MSYRILCLDTYQITPAANVAAAFELARYTRAYQIWKGRTMVCQVGV